MKKIYNSKPLLSGGPKLNLFIINCIQLNILACLNLLISDILKFLNDFSLIFIIKYECNIAVS